MHPEKRDDLEVKLLCLALALTSIIIGFFIGMYIFIILPIGGCLIIYRSLNKIVSRPQDKWIDT